MRAEEDWVKENKPPPAVLSSAWLLAGLALSAGALLAALAVDLALPAPLPRRAALDTPERFVAELAHDHLVNLTAVGPRVAGSYENEVVTVAVLVSAIRRIAEQASPHNRVELDVQRASGSFSLAFMDGMNHVYRDVQNVVARVRGAGGAARAAGRSALLLNCHFDSVPDSPGASDDGAGCAVMLETLRALAATGRPLRHDAIFLFNGAEENILQASHAFITQHKWARSVRAFINIEACGAGGREVMFQAGPFDPWIIEVYAGAVPHPFASSLAQELFQSGAIPADTDFRIFRDFGKLSGVDLAWSANGYVYHTRLDTAERVPPAALQRTGDNVLALARGLLASPRLAQAADPQERTPAFFDVLGLVLLVAGPRAAAALAAAALALLALKVHANARAAQRHLFVAYGAWWRFVLAGAAALLLAGAGGALAAAGAGALLHAAGARLTFYSRPWLLGALFALPGVAAGWALLAALWRAALRRAAGGGLLRRGWWGARALHDAAALLAGGALAACAARGLRSGFLPLLWVLLPSAADAAASAARLRPLLRACLWVAGAALPLLQTAYLLVNTLRMFVPIMGRAGAQPVPPDVVMALLTVALAQLLLSWLLPFVGAARDVPRLARWLGALGGAALLLALSGGAGAPYGAATPQRLMLFHTRRTAHPAAAPPDHFYWAPELDANTLRALRDHVGAAAALGAAECARAPYCGAPYYLPVLALVGRSYAVPAPAAPRARLDATLRVERAAGGARSLWLNVTRAPQHVVLIVAPAPGVALTGVAQAGAAEGAAPLAGAAWGARRTYFYSLHAARAPAAWALELRFEGGGARLADVSLAGHAMFGADSLHEAHAALLRRLPPAVAATGWGVDLHLYEL